MTKLIAANVRPHLGWKLTRVTCTQLRPDERSCSDAVHLAENAPLVTVVGRACSSDDVWSDAVGFRERRRETADVPLVLRKRLRPDTHGPEATAPEGVETDAVVARAAPHQHLRLEPATRVHRPQCDDPGKLRSPITRVADLFPRNRRVQPARFRLHHEIGVAVSPARDPNGVGAAVSVDVSDER